MVFKMRTFSLSNDFLDADLGSNPLPPFLTLPPSPPSRSATCLGGIFGRIAITSPRAAVPATLHGTQQQRPLSGKDRLGIGIVGESEPQGSSTLNYTMPSAIQKLKNHVRSLNCSKSRSNVLPSSEMVSALTRVEKAKQSEEPLRKVMYFSCSGPN